MPHVTAEQLSPSTPSGREEDCRPALPPEDTDQKPELGRPQHSPRQPGHPSTMDLCLSFKERTSLQQLVSTNPQLVRLQLSFNCLSQLSGISALCSSLRQLDLSHNRLTSSSIQELSTLQGLTECRLGHNRISSVETLAALHDLQFLALHNNSISTAADVLQLSALSRLWHLTLCHNPVCKQQDWRAATVSMMPALQALDSAVVTAAERAAASAHAGVWASAGEQEYSCSSTPRDTPSSAASESGSTPSDPEQQRGGCKPISRGSSGRAGMLRPRVSSAAGAGPDDSMSIKDATSLLPSMTLKPLKPSTVVRRPAQAAQPSKYGYSRARPLTVLQKSMYEASGSPAVLFHSNGSASITWPEGGMAASLDPEEPPASGSSTASTPGSSNRSASSSVSGSLPPIQGYRLLAMYRSITCVAASFDSSGGFVQWPNGQLMLVWSKRERQGTAYGPDGRVTHTFSGSKRSGALTDEITARLDEHLSIRFPAGSFDLQLLFDCDGCQAVLSQRHGAVLPERAAPQQAAPSCSPGSSQTATQAQQQAVCEGGSDAAAALAGLPGDDDMQTLLARARALMAETDSESLPAAAVEEVTAPAAGVVLRQPPDAPDDVQEDVQDMLARARAAVAATNAAVRGLAL